MRFSFFIDKLAPWLLKHLLGKFPSQVHDHQLHKIPLFFLNGTWHSGNPFPLLFDCCCCLVAQSCPTLCDPMDCSTSSFPVLHYLPEVAQSHVQQVSDAIQPSYPLSSPSPPAFNLSQHQGLFQWVSASHQVAKVLGVSVSASVLPMNIQGWIPLGLTDLISLLSKKLSRVFSSTTVQKHQFFGAQPSLWSNSNNHMWLLEKP